MYTIHKKVVIFKKKKKIIYKSYYNNLESSFNVHEYFFPRKNVYKLRIKAYTLTHNLKNWDKYVINTNLA